MSYSISNFDLKSFFFGGLNHIRIAVNANGIPAAAQQQP
ncbi:hypothetical protein AGR4C_Lc120169 [Agrobacterium tumefaciens str. Kerr 14]|uniref:Uncharacterized protein n=1 Tax=Agrobacterium tumefaciens str. Kerr 14 TaxID=1183424 RepID=A0A1S7R9S0_AGRTU|nr:hypothetical protein AGR4C_Lc120169 [Agrobacterium tumefaciens str. Kerr 14]